MKKLIIPLALIILTACATPNQEEAVDLYEEVALPYEVVVLYEPEEINRLDLHIGVLRGPTGLAALQLMADGNYEFTLAAAPDEIVPLFVQGNLDLAAVPPNLAAVLYNNVGNVSVLAIHTLGILHVIDTTGEINQISDLEGREVFLSGLGGVPEFAFNYILNMNGLVPHQDVFLDFRGEHTEIAALMQAGQAQIAVLPEPFATTVVNSHEDARFALNLTAEWDRVQPDYPMIMGVLIGRRDFIENNRPGIDVFLQEYERSINFTNEELAYSSQMAVDFDIIPNAAIAYQAIPRSNIVFISGGGIQDYLMGFLRVLYDENPASVGGALPGEDFFID